MVFVAGVQRSGTNMLMNVLERSMDTDVYHESDNRAFSNYQMRDIDTIRSLFKQSCASRFIIKSLCELQKLPAFMDEFAPAKTIWITRKYSDVINSMRASFSNQAVLLKRLAVDRNSVGWWGQGMSDKTFSMINRLVGMGIDDDNAAALSWYIRSVLFFEQGLDRDNRVLLVQYEKLVSCPVEEFQRIFEFIDIRYNPKCSIMVRSSSVGRSPSVQLENEVEQICDELQERFRRVLAQQGGPKREHGTQDSYQEIL